MFKTEKFESEQIGDGNERERVNHLWQPMNVSNVLSRMFKENILGYLFGSSGKKSERIMKKRIFLLMNILRNPHTRTDLTRNRNGNPQMLRLIDEITKVCCLIFYVRTSCRNYVLFSQISINLNL